MFRLVTSVESSQDTLAVVQEPLRLSFRELTQVVTHVTRVLVSNGITPGSYVLNNLETSIGWLVTMLATFDANATYVPVGTVNHPGKRLVPKLSSEISTYCRFMIASEDTVNSLVPELKPRIVPLDLDPRWKRILKGMVLAVFLDVIEDREPKCRDRFSFAYIVHTSGTTRRDSVGVPVRVPVDAAVTSVIGIRDEVYRKTLGKGPCLVSAPPTFDPSITETIAPLSLGKPILLTPPKIRLSPPDLLDVIIRNGVSVLPATPSLFLRFSPKEQQDILQGRTPVTDVLLGGEPVPKSLLRELVGNTATVWNLYGTTEVGVWATVARLDPDVVPDLGIPLPNTIVKLMDSDTRTEIDGFDITGEVYIGGTQRTCIVGDESEGTVMRPTGDFARYESLGRLVFVGRRDRVVKRMGRKVPLDGIADVLASLPGIRGVHVLNMTDPRSQTEMLVAFVQKSKVPQYSIHELNEHARSNCDSYACPDRIILVDESDWRITSHGKVDETPFLKLLQTPSAPSVPVKKNHPKDLRIQISELDEFLKSRARVLAGSDDPTGDWYYLAEGGDSMTIRRAAQEVIEWIGEKPGDSSKSCFYMHPMTICSDVDLQRRIVSVLLHTSLSDASRLLLLGPPTAQKRKRTDRQLLPVGNVSPVLSPLDPLPELPEDEEEEWRRSWEKGTEVQVFRRGGTVHIDGLDGCELSVGWRVGMEKCVDAAPVVVRRVDDRGRTYTTAFFVSHSGLVTSISLTTGRVHWRHHPGGRLESPPDLTPCGKFLTLGSHDGYLYFVPTCPSPHVDIANLVRKIRIGSEIKGPVARDVDRGIVWCADAKGRVVAVECGEAEPVVVVAEWMAHGGVSAGVVVNEEDGSIIVATLKGTLTCLRGLLHHQSVDSSSSQKKIYTLEPTWTRNLGSPIFSTPAIFKTRIDAKEQNEKWIVVVGCVDGNVKAYIGTDGTMLWTHTLHHPIFAPITSTSPLLLLIGSHTTLTILNASTGTPLISQTLDSRIFGAPSFLRTPNSSYVLVCTVQGKLWILNTREEEEEGVVGEWDLFPEEVFSAPVLVPGTDGSGCHVLVGCRDDAGWMVNVR